MKTVEEYQEQTEKRWRKLARGAEVTRCGWCQFVEDILGHGSCYVAYCPVAHVFGVPCGSIAQVRAFWETPPGLDEQEAAQAVLDLAIEHREELIAAARAILEEVKGGQEAV